MKGRKHEASWPSVWNQVRDAIARSNAPDEVRQAALPCNVGWNYHDGKFYIFCNEVLYRWLEVPDAPDAPSNIGIIKPYIWPMMQRYNCKDLYYRLIKTNIMIKH